jgi:flagellar assembly protein FliH
MGRVIKANTIATKPTPIGVAAEKAKAELVAARVSLGRIREAARGDIVDLAVAIAEKVIGQSVVMNPALLDEIYRDAVSLMPDNEPVRLAVHPTDRPGSRVDKMAEKLGIELIEDPAVGRAGCRVTAGDLEVDATLNTVLEALTRALKGPADE